MPPAAPSFHSSSGKLALLASLLTAASIHLAAAAEPVWPGYGGDAQHTAISSVASQPLSSILWQTPVDLDPQYIGGNLYIHYGSALITAANTVLVPVKTGATGGFRIDAHNGSDGSLLWSQPTDYILPIPAASWVPSYSPVLSNASRLYYPGAGGTIYYRDTPDSAAPAATGHLAFYDITNYTANKAAFDKNVFINTPITSDAAGNIYFGYQVDKSTAQTLNLHGGIAKIDSHGVGTWMEAATLSSGMTKVAQNSAPAISADGTKVYVALNDGYSGRLVQLDTSNLALVSKSPALNAVIDVSSASPTIGPNGDVYFGTNDGYNGRGVMNHFSADLLQTKVPGSFGWDDTASIVPASMVASYTGSSSYLLMCKYNNYAGRSGDGVNKLAILDPLDLTQIDPVTGLIVMKEVLTIAGVTRDTDYPDFPDAVREWCINTAVVDPFTNSILVNNEDGKLYRWDLATNSFTDSITLTSGLGEAYTPTIIGADGNVYAINNATLFAVGIPEPATFALTLLGALPLLQRRRRQ